MLIKNTAITFTWNLKATDTVGANLETYYDLQVTEPNGTVTYLEGETDWAGANFSAPGSVASGTDGYISEIYTPTEAGVYTFILGTGGSTNFTILDTVLALVVDSDTLVTNTVVL